MVEQFEDLLVRILLLAACISFVSTGRRRGAGRGVGRGPKHQGRGGSSAPVVQALSILFPRPELGAWGRGRPCAYALVLLHTPQAGFILSFKGVLGQNTEAKPPPQLQGLRGLGLPPERRSPQLGSGSDSAELRATTAPGMPRGAQPIPERPGAPAPPSWR